MAEGLWRLLEAWDGQGVWAGRDAPTGSWIFIALHDLAPGPAVGGCRMRHYARPEDGARDAMRLAEGMTFKWAALDFPFGGGKSVLAVPGPLRGEAREGLLRRFGRLLGGLRGTYSTGVDLGTTPEDMAVVAAEAPHVLGQVDGRSVDPGPYTALGVYEGIRAALAHVFGEASPAGRRVLIQGVGDVGLPLARQLAEDGAELLLADIDPAVAESAVRELEGRTVAAQEALTAQCDVLAPCAIGGVLDEETIPALRCRVVAGSANNQLEEPDDAERLHDRGILYAPDYIVNAGGAIAFGRMHMGERENSAIREEVRGIGRTLREIFREAEEADESPARAAERRARRNLERARVGRGSGPEAERSSPDLSPAGGPASR